MARTATVRKVRGGWKAQLYKDGRPSSFAIYTRKLAAQSYADQWRSGSKVTSGQRIRKKNPMGMPWLVLAVGAVAAYFLFSKPAVASPGVIITPIPIPGVTSPPVAMPAVPGQDDDLPPVPDPMSNYNYIRG